MASNAISVSLKVFVDERKKKVIFAEAAEDFVEILFSFFTLPLGTIAGFLNKQEGSNNMKLGSFTSLYRSVQSIDVQFVRGKSTKNLLLNPFSSSSYLCRNLKLNLYDAADTYAVSSLQFVKKKGSFIITDDLNITPFVLQKSIEFLNTLGVEYTDLVEKTISFDVEHFLNLLKWSLYTNNPLTNLIYGASINPCLNSCSRFISNATPSNTAQPQTINLLVQKSKKKVLCAQVDNFFVELLFSFLTIPLGAVKRLTMDDHDFKVGIDNLYTSISSLVDGNNLKTENIEHKLLDPKVQDCYHRVTDFLPIYHVTAHPGGFLQDQSSFLVSDDLEITPSPSISTISKFTLGIRGDDIEVLQVSIGEQEARLILKACLTTTSVLTHCLGALRKSPKVDTST